MDSLDVIRRWHGRDELPIGEITRRTGLSRNTVRKYLAIGVTEPKYTPRKSLSKLDAYAETQSSWLKREARRPRQQRRHLKQLYHDRVALGYQGSYDRVALGYEGSYDRVATFARDWRQRECEAACLAKRLIHADLVILDELGYLPCSQAGGALLFHLISSLYEQTSLIITTNLGFSEWATVVMISINDC